MEALTGACVRAGRHAASCRLTRPHPAAAVAALTVYDMVKSVTKHAKVTDLQLEAKSGGKSGDWSRGGGTSSPSC